MCAASPALIWCGEATPLAGQAAEESLRLRKHPSWWRSRQSARGLQVGEDLGMDGTKFAVLHHIERGRSVNQGAPILLVAPEDVDRFVRVVPSITKCGGAAGQRPKPLNVIL